MQYLYLMAMGMSTRLVIQMAVKSKYDCSSVSRTREREGGGVEGAQEVDWIGPISGWSTIPQRKLLACHLI